MAGKTAYRIVASLLTGLLLLQGALPATLALVASPLIGDTDPPLLKGASRMRAGVSAPPSNLPVSPSKRISLLDSLGRLSRTVPRQERKRWDQVLTSKSHTPQEKFRALIWRAETRLALDQEPEEAYQQFIDIAKTRAPKNIVGLAKYDAAVCQYYSGRFDEAADSFSKLLRSEERGFDRRDCALFLKHTEACAQYHARRADLGIIEPGRIDPLCGAAGLAVCAKILGKPYEKNVALDVVRHTGFGSSAEDIVAGASKLGLHAYPITGGSDAIKASPKPLVAHVERDHFITVVAADDTGVTYYCSDCGPWPGGEQRLSWKQWRAMEADLLIPVVVPGSPEDNALSMLGTPQSLLGTLQAAVGVGVPVATGAQDLLRALLAAGVSIFANPVVVVCGEKLGGMHCEPCMKYCPIDLGAKFASGTGIDPVNLANAEEEYLPEPDLVVYNPKGPSVVWKRLYYSLSNTPHNGFGMSWSHSYNLYIEDNAPTTDGVPDGILEIPIPNCYLVTQNGNRIHFTVPPGVLPATGSPITATVDKGFAYHIEWKYDAIGDSTYYEITMPDRSVIKTMSRLVAGDTHLYPVKITDRNSNYITLQ